MKFSLLTKRLRRGVSAGPLETLYEEARLEKPVRRGLNWVMGGNMFGTLHGIICGGGTAAMVGLAGALGAGDMEFGLLVALPQVAALMQLPFSALVNKTQKRKIWLLTIGLFSRFLWMLFGFLPLLGGTRWFTEMTVAKLKGVAPSFSRASFRRMISAFAVSSIATSRALLCVSADSCRSTFRSLSRSTLSCWASAPGTGDPRKYPPGSSAPESTVFSASDMVSTTFTLRRVYRFDDSPATQATHGLRPLVFAVPRLSGNPIAARGFPAYRPDPR